MKLHLLLVLLPLAGLAAGAEIPFEKADEIPARAYDLIRDKRVIWLGELHGTKEAPQLFLGLVKLVCKHHPTPPVIALEIPTTDQRALDRYLANEDDSFLRSSPFFSSKLKDGRSSQALVALLSLLRKEKIAAVVCFDSPGAESPQQRDTAMAENLQACARKYPGAKLLVLSGNIHASIIQGTEWDSAYRPAAYELMRHVGPLVSFRLAYEGGTIWARTEAGFGEQKVTGGKWTGNAPHYITLYAKPVRGYHGAIFTRILTGSPPW